MSDLKIEYLDIHELKPYENNAKVHTGEQVEQICESIKQFGMNDPVAVWKDNVIIEGHGRYLACLKLGIDAIPVIKLDSLTDEERRAYTLIHNKLTMNTDFNLDILNRELFNFKNIDMSKFSFELPSEEEVEIKTVKIRPYSKVHYLISLDINSNDKVIELIDKLKKIGGVEVDSTLN